MGVWGPAAASPLEQIAPRAHLLQCIHPVFCDRAIIQASWPSVSALISTRCPRCPTGPRLPCRCRASPPPRDHNTRLSRPDSALMPWAGSGMSFCFRAVAPGARPCEEAAWLGRSSGRGLRLEESAPLPQPAGACRLRQRRRFVACFHFCVSPSPVWCSECTKQGRPFWQTGPGFG